MKFDNDYNSLWTIKEAHSEVPKTYSINIKLNNFFKVKRLNVVIKSDLNTF
jgi:hypothetical protein